MDRIETALPTTRFRSFVMLAEMRTGSNFLAANLNAFDGIVCFGEMFNPHFIGKKDCMEMLGVSIEKRQENPRKLLERMQETQPNDLTGFRYFHDHDPRVLDLILQDPSCAKIILTRNPLDSYVSLKIAQETGQWKLTRLKALKSAKITFDPDEFDALLDHQHAFQLRILHALQTSGQTGFYINYDDLSDLDVLNGLANWLGVPDRLAEIDQSLIKQNPEPLSEKVENFDAMETALARIDRFNISQIPSFEPRRPLRVPSLVAAKGAPILYLPIAGGPEAEISAWMEKLGRRSDEQGLLTDFNQKTLRHWFGAHPNHRSFTVLRHPLLRAFVAFHRQILSGKLADHRRFLQRHQNVDLPPKGNAFRNDAEHHDAFLGFLNYLKLVISGQTGGRIAPMLASQTASLAGICALKPVDLVLREDQIETGLAFLLSEYDLPCPDYGQSPHWAQTLAAIYSPALEAAAREVFVRDYHGFGFTAWQAKA